MDYNVAKELIYAISQLNRTLKRIDKSLTILAEAQDNSPPPEPECDYVERAFIKEMNAIVYTCTSPSECLYKEPIEHSQMFFCLRYGLRAGGAE